jgi:predicted CXXCH cytochrome family protein
VAHRSPTAGIARRREAGRVAARAAILAAAVLAAGATAWWLAAASRPGGPAPAPARHPGFVGVAACEECHPDETAKWRESDHFRSMEVPSPKTVIADFDGTSFEYHGVRTTFSRDGDRYRVRTDGPDGRLADFDVAYTFGFRPLQQFLLPLPGGRLQALNVCWDTRPAEQGGQRWFHLYPDENVDSRHPFHWTGPFQNWNYMCAECHSTDLVRGWDAKAGRYDTHWSETNVSCEACHGPGERHVAWAREREANPPPADEDPATVDPALDVRFTDLDDGDWTFEHGNPTAKRVLPTVFRAEVETCGRCHARREPNRETYAFGKPLADSYNVSLLAEGLYHADGQFLDEVYEYGSFLQSKMYRRGVTCEDCHDAHSGKRRLPGNELCTRCHQKDTFDRREHHFHPVAGEAPSDALPAEARAAARRSGDDATLCTSCHMRPRKYMVVDPRFDHSFRVPRPDLSPVTGAPNACNECHTDQSSEWAVGWVRKWYGERSRAGTYHYGLAIAAGRGARPGAGRLLVQAAADDDLAPMARATALSVLRDWMGPDAHDAVVRASRDPETLVRLGAAETLDALPPELQLEVGLRLLADPVRGVRVQAAQRLAGLPPDGLPPGAAEAVAKGVREYVESQRVNEDRAEAHANIGNVEIANGDLVSAEAAFRRALVLRPGFDRVAVNLADVLRRTGREAEAESLLRDVIPRTPVPGDAHHALGLALVRQRRIPEAMEHLRKAMELRPEEARYATVYAIALNDTGRPAEALDVLRRAQALRPADRGLLETLAVYSSQAGDREAALRWARLLRDESMGDAGAADLVEAIERGR